MKLKRIELTNVKAENWKRFKLIALYYEKNMGTTFDYIIENFSAEIIEKIKRDNEQKEIQKEILSNIKRIG